MDRSRHAGAWSGEPASFNSSTMTSRRRLETWIPARNVPRPGVWLQGSQSSGREFETASSLGREGARPEPRCRGASRAVAARTAQTDWGDG